jgi:transposase
MTSLESDDDDDKEGVENKASEAGFQESRAVTDQVRTTRQSLAESFSQVYTIASLHLTVQVGCSHYPQKPYDLRAKSRTYQTKWHSSVQSFKVMSFHRATTLPYFLNHYQACSTYPQNPPI